MGEEDTILFAIGDTVTAIGDTVGEEDCGNCSIGGKTDGCW